jgi:hypothetical protein
MPRKVWSQLIAAGGVFNPLDGWDYEFAPWPGVMEMVHRATAVGMVSTVVSGSDRLQEEDPVPAGGTAGVTPTTFDAPPLTDEFAVRDRLKVQYRNPTGGGITVDGYIDITPQRA